MTVRRLAALGENKLLNFEVNFCNLTAVLLSILILFQRFVEAKEYTVLCIIYEEIEVVMRHSKTLSQLSLTAWFRIPQNGIYALQSSTPFGGRDHMMQVVEFRTLLSIS